MKAQKKAAEDQTFTTPPDKFSTVMLKGRELEIPTTSIKPGAIVTPFLNTPWNIIKYAFKRSPLSSYALGNKVAAYKLQTKKFKSGSITEAEY